MKAWAMICVVVLLVAVAIPTVAGDKHNCSASAEDCLRKMQDKMETKAWLGIETKVVEGKPFLEIIGEVLRNQRDLVVKSAGGRGGS